MKKYGLDGSKELALQKIGKEYSLTRERVRQIETQALMRFRRLIIGNELYTNVLEECKKILEVHGGILREDALMLDQRRCHVRQHRLAMRLGAPQMIYFLIMSHRF